MLPRDLLIIAGLLAILLLGYRDLRRALKKRSNVEEMRDEESHG